MRRRLRGQRQGGGAEVPAGVVDGVDAERAGTFGAVDDPDKALRGVGSRQDQGEGVLVLGKGRRRLGQQEGDGERFGEVGAALEERAVARGATESGMGGEGGR